ncbi:3-mercaptopyruvate sulfurtransferase [Martelella mediterranea]|uniref:3-mercaptopyruvate sulfurtransferase n=1 Tax=Martelella mediterranea TaxID=293089 RepID=A0A4R3NUR1_9HYPH|nr:3-mercaptopyruvate sulfurtransferase [Martelella mediterranea]TCT40302.1 thiosulfate/3-mercaptopyruvate sulfurtransferase [Martelella mediterranea]
MSARLSPFIVSPDWLETRLGASGLSIIDASWYLPAHNRSGKAEYAKHHIPGAIFFDQDEIADKTTGLPHSLPAPDFFASEMGKRGISEKDTIVVYDGPGFFSAPRVWWMLQIMGAHEVFVLDGGFDGWKAARRPVTSKTVQPEPATFTPDFDTKRVTSFQDMMQIVESGEKQIADARGAGRFAAEEAEPRPGMRSGHMPGAKNLPATAFSENGHFRSLDELDAMFRDAGIDLSGPVVTSCGSGVTAAIITLALESLGHRDHSLYDGSWSEWGSRTDTPVVTGKA